MTRTPKNIRALALATALLLAGVPLARQILSIPAEADAPALTAGQPVTPDNTGTLSRVPGKAQSGTPTFAASGLAAIPRDDPASQNPVERAVALGRILATRLEPAASANQWLRTRLVQTSVQPRPVRVVELWLMDPAAPAATCLRREMFLADQLIVRAPLAAEELPLRQRFAAAGLLLSERLAEGLFTVRLTKAELDAVPAALQFLAAHPELASSAEADGVGFGGGTPNDPRFSEQWGLHNTGQLSGTVDADLNGPEFWDILDSTPGLVIAVLDSGLNFTHPDLQNIAWANPGEISGDGIDNDLSGKIDDLTGWDFVNNDNNPTDDHGHGSNVSGIIAANRNNGVGVAGLLSGVQILTCKILNASNSGLTSNLIAATTYARQRGVSLMNLSLQNYPFSTALNTEFTACQAAGILLSICAGNQGVNNDLTPNYPSSYSHPNIIAVGNHDRTDARWSGTFNPSNYGLVSVDLFAPGRDILSPILGTAYSSYTGTSQATPYVTAICGALKYANPTWTAVEIKASVLSSVVTKAGYNGLCVTGGRAHAVNSVAHAFRQLPNQDTDGDQFSNLFEYLAGTRIDSTAQRPAFVSDIQDGFLRLRLPRVARPDAHFVIETSTDLLGWTSVGVTDFSTPDTLLGGVALAGTTRVFLRIRAVP